jgi:hypothetical protein
MWGVALSAKACPSEGGEAKAKLSVGKKLSFKVLPLGALGGLAVESLRPPSLDYLLNNSSWLFYTTARGGGLLRFWRFWPFLPFLRSSGKIHVSSRIPQGPRPR